MRGSMQHVAPEATVQKITDLLADLDGSIGADTQSVLTTVTAQLSLLTPGTWIASLLGKDPATSRVVVADVSNPDRATFVESHFAPSDRSGLSRTPGIALRVIEMSRSELIVDASVEELVALIGGPDLVSAAARTPNSSRVVTFLMVPMRARGAILGALGVVRWDSVDHPTDEDVSWVQKVADRLAAILENARVRVLADERLDRINAVRHVVFAMAFGHSAQLILADIARYAAAGLRADAADILLLDADGRLAVAAFTGFRSAPSLAFKWTMTRPSGTIPGHTERLREVESMGEARRGSLLATEGFKEHRSSLVTARGHTFGVLEAFHRSNFEPDQGWVDFLDLMAAAAAMALITPEPATSRRSSPAHGVRGGADYTHLERRIIELVVEGATNHEIGVELHLSESTIKFHIRQLLDKSGAKNRTELASRATQLGWL